MKKISIAWIAILPAALLCLTAFFLLSCPPEPGFDWRLRISPAEHAAVVAETNHLYTKAAYTVTWAIQLGYVAWLGMKWRAQKHPSSR
jgi:hypothetical protein